MLLDACRNDRYGFLQRLFPYTFPRSRQIAEYMLRYHSVFERSIVNENTLRVITRSVLEAGKGGERGHNIGFNPITENIDIRSK